MLTGYSLPAGRRTASTEMEGTWNQRVAKSPGAADVGRPPLT
jgi:hypothetical protein